MIPADVARLGLAIWGGLLLGACTGDLVEPDCAGALELVLQGEVGGKQAEALLPDLQGRWLEPRFYLNLPDPQQEALQLQADNPRAKSWWVLEFGYNPSAADAEIELLDTNLATDMQRAAARTYQVKSHARLLGGDPGEQLCDPTAGELCGGLGVYQPGSFTPSTDVAGERPYDAYLPVRSGTLTFTHWSTEEKHGVFELELDWELSNGQPSGGRVQGCFKARLTPVSGRKGFLLE